MLIDKENEKPKSENEYIRVFNYFHDEYTGMMKDYLIRHKVKLNDDDCLINYSIDGLSLAIMNIRRIMKARGCTPVQIAEAAETMCKWCGIKLPEGFVNRN